MTNDSAELQTGGTVAAHLESSRKDPAPAPMQARSRRTMERLLNAAERVFVRDSFAGATVAGIAAAARVSVGAFYGRFADKAAFLDAFFERLFALSRSEIDASDPLAAAH